MNATKQLDHTVGRFEARPKTSNARRSDIRLFSFADIKLRKETHLWWKCNPRVIAFLVSRRFELLVVVETLFNVTK